MKRVIMLIVSILLVQSTTFSARKYMFGGEMYTIYSTSPTRRMFYLNNHPEQNGFLTAGYNGYGGAYSTFPDRTGIGRTALVFIGKLAECGGSVHVRTFLGIDLSGVQPPVYMSMWLNAGSAFAAPQDSGIIYTLNLDATHNIRLHWSNLNKIGLSINGGAPTWATTTHAMNTGWFRIKLYSSWDTLANGTTKTVLYDQGTDSVVNTTRISSSPPISMQWGVLSTMNDLGHQMDLRIDDLFLNDSKGTVETGFADSSSYVLYMPADSDVAINGWRNADGSATNLRDATKNVPPLGSTTETATTNIFDTTSSATDNYDAALKTYNAFGIPSNHYIRVAQAVVRTAEHVATGTANGSISLFSNPNDTTETPFVYGGDGGAHQKDSVDWDVCGLTTPDNVYVSYRGKPVYITNQSMISRTVRPVVRLGKRTASTKRVEADQLGVLLEVSPNPLGQAPIKLQGRIINTKP